MKCACAIVGDICTLGALRKDAAGPKGRGPSCVPVPVAQCSRHERAREREYILCLSTRVSVAQGNRCVISLCGSIWFGFRINLR